MRRAKLSESRLEAAHLENADCRGASFEGSQLVRADLRGCRLARCDLSGAELTGSVYDAKTEWPEEFDAQAAGCVLIGPGRSYDRMDFRDVWLCGSDLSGCRFRGVDFSGANLIEASFSQSQFEDCKMVRAFVDRAADWEHVRGVRVKGLRESAGHL